MNLTHQPVYQKSHKSSRKPTRSEQKHMDRVGKLPCIISDQDCDYAPYYRPTLHHTRTGAGGRKDHMKVLPLCFRHHEGDLGINSLSGAMSRREWEARYGTEEQLLRKLQGILDGGV